LLINSHIEPIQFVLPGQENLGWELFLDTTNEEGFLREPRGFSSGDDVDLADRSAYLLRLTSGEQAKAREESWKKRHFEFRTTSTEDERAGGTK
jgi:hypothetical protein